MNQNVKGLFLYFLLNCLSFGSQNLLLNGSFEIEGDTSTNYYELGNVSLIPPATGFGVVPEWTFRNIGNFGGTASGANGYVDAYPAFFGTPFGDRFIILGNGSADPGNEIYQSGINLSPGTYKASVFACGYGNSFHDVSFGIALTKDLDNSVIASGNFSSLVFSENYNEYNLEINIVEATVASFRIFDSTAANSAGSADVHLDNAILQLVPEPSAFSLLAVGLGGLAILRRRRS